MFGKKATKVSVDRQIEIISSFERLKESLDEIKTMKSPALREAALDCLYVRTHILECKIQELFIEDLLRFEKF